MIGGMNELRALLAAGHVTHLPGVYDPASAALAVRAGHRAVYLSGAAIAATMLGRPDLGFTPATQIADRAAVLAPALDGVPLLADADVGFDSPDHGVWSALAYERAGISGLCLSDVEDDGVGVGLGRNATMNVERITALVAQVPEVALIAQARGRDLAETIQRCRAYAGAGADAVLPAGVPETHLDRLRAALPGVPLAVNRSETAAGGTHLSDADLADLGVRLVLHPLAAVLAALRAESLVYRAIADEGDAERVDRMPLAVFTPMTRPPLTASPAGPLLAAAAAEPEPLGPEPGTDRIDT
jgi:2-methylisocitrate lyase-like PEP mutase family enzyme